MAADFYKTLGVDESASQDEIKKSFRKLAKLHHPDRNKGAKKSEAKFKELSEAYETLSDPSKRAEYDQLRRFGSADPYTARTGRQSFESSFRRMRRDPADSDTTQFDSFTDMDDLFGSLFGSRAGTFGAEERTESTESRGSRRSSDTEADLIVSFAEAALGARKEIQLPNGKRVAVRIPAGIEHESKLRLAGQGSSAPIRSRSARKAADLHLRIMVQPDPNFSRNGLDLITPLTIDFREAILGCKKEVRTLSERLSLTVPAGTQPGAQLRLRGKGIVTSERAGDLLVDIRVTLPTSVNEKQRKLLEEWE